MLESIKIKIQMAPTFPRGPLRYLSKITKSRQYCSIDLQAKKVDEDYKSTKRKVRNVSTDIIEYLRKNNPCFDVESFPKKYLVKTKNPKGLYLANPDIAEQVATVLKPHIEKCNAKVIECNPGLGLLTSLLLEMKINKLYLHEADPFFYGNLDTMFSLGKVKLTNTDLIQVPKFNPGKNYQSLDYLQKTEWDNDCSYQMIAVLSNQSFLRNVLRSFNSQDGLLSYGRPLLYLFITPATYSKLIAGPHEPWNLYKPLAVLFQIVFHIDLLMTVDRRAFLPWPNTAASSDKLVHRGSLSSKDDPMYLIRVEGRRDLFRKLGQHNAHRTKTLQKFVTHAIGRKKQRVIPTIEQWVPGFGPHLIARDINVYTLFNELTPDEILDIFCMIHHIPGYEEFDIPEDEIEEKANEARIDTSIDMFPEEEEAEQDDDIPGTS